MYSTMHYFNKPTCDLRFARWIFFETFVIICWLLIKINILKKSYRNTITVSNGLYPDQNLRSVGTKLGPNYLQMLSADKERAGNLVNSEYKSG